MYYFTGWYLDTCNFEMPRPRGGPTSPEYSRVDHLWLKEIESG